MYQGCGVINFVLLYDEEPQFKVESYIGLGGPMVKWGEMEAICFGMLVLRTQYIRDTKALLYFPESDSFSTTVSPTQLVILNQSIDNEMMANGKVALEKILESPPKRSRQPPKLFSPQLIKKSLGVKLRASPGTGSQINKKKKKKKKHIQHNVVIVDDESQYDDEHHYDDCGLSSFSPSPCSFSPPSSFSSSSSRKSRSSSSILSEFSPTQLKW